jgi:hypothetical protein
MGRAHARHTSLLTYGGPQTLTWTNVSVSRSIVRLQRSHSMMVIAAIVPLHATDKIRGGAHAAPDSSAEQQPVEFLAKVRNFRPIGVNDRPEEDAAM